MASWLRETYLYVNSLEDLFRDLDFSLKYFFSLLAASPPGLVQRIRLEIAAHDGNLYAVRNQRPGRVGFTLQEDLLEVVGLGLRRFYQVVGQRWLAAAE